MGCLSRGLGVAWSAVKLDLDFEVPVWRKSSKTQTIVPFSESFKIGRFLDFFSRLWPQNQNWTSQHFWPHQDLFDRHPTSLCCNHFYFWLYKGEFGNCQYQNQQKECSDYIDYLLKCYQYYICNQEMYSRTFFRIMMVIRGGLTLHPWWCFTFHTSQFCWKFYQWTLTVTMCWVIKKQNINL